MRKLLLAFSIVLLSTASFGLGETVPPGGATSSSGGAAPTGTGAYAGIDGWVARQVDGSQYATLSDTWDWYLTEFNNEAPSFSTDGTFGTGLFESRHVGGAGCAPADAIVLDAGKGSMCNTATGVDNDSNVVTWAAPGNGAGYVFDSPAFTSAAEGSEWLISGVLAPRRPSDMTFLFGFATDSGTDLFADDGSMTCAAGTTACILLHAGDDRVLKLSVSGALSGTVSETTIGTLDIPDTYQANTLPGFELAMRVEHTTQGDAGGSLGVGVVTVYLNGEVISTTTEVPDRYTSAMVPVLGIQDEGSAAPIGLFIHRLLVAENGTALNPAIGLE